jgi:hypothetical protein
MGQAHLAIGLPGHDGPAHRAFRIEAEIGEHLSPSAQAACRQNPASWRSVVDSGGAGEQTRSMVNLTGGGGRRGAHRSRLAAAWYSVTEKRPSVERTKGRRRSSSGRRGTTWLGGTRGCNGWTRGDRKAAGDDELLAGKHEARHWWLSGWSTVRQLVDEAQSTQGGRVSEAAAPVLGLMA